MVTSASHDGRASRGGRMQARPQEPCQAVSLPREICRGTDRTRDRILYGDQPVVASSASQYRATSVVPR
jgi:hypothetical protein